MTTEMYADVKVELDADVVADIFEPLQRVLDQTKSSKVLSRYEPLSNITCFWLT